MTPPLPSSPFASPEFLPQAPANRAPLAPGLRRAADLLDATAKERAARSRWHRAQALTEDAAAARARADALRLRREAAAEEAGQ